MKSLLVIVNNYHNFSGGRYGTFLMLLALASNGVKVTYLTNFFPDYLLGLKNHNGFKNIYIDQSLKKTIFKKGNYSGILLIPDLHPTTIYLKAVMTAFINRINISILNFETPNWIKKTTGQSQNKFKWLQIKDLSKYSSSIISISKLGNAFTSTIYPSVSPLKSLLYTFVI